MRILLALIGVGLLAATAEGHSILGSISTAGATDSPTLTIPPPETNSPMVPPILDSWLGSLPPGVMSGAGLPFAQDSLASPGWTLWESGLVNGNWQFVSETSNSPGPTALPPLNSPMGSTGTSVSMSSAGPWIVKTEYVSLVAFPAPEPSGIALTASGLAALAFWRLRRN